jgi:hypothetical protein
VPSIATVDRTKTLAVAGVSSKGACKGDLGACLFEAKLAKKLQSFVESSTSGSTGASTKSSSNPKPYVIRDGVSKTLKRCHITNMRIRKQR